VKRAAFAVAVGVVLAWSLSPAAWQLATALKPDSEITTTPTVYLPRPPTLRHFSALAKRKPLGRYLLNSFEASAAATLVAVGVGLFAASALARMAERSRRRVLLGFLLLVSFPPVLLLFPLYEAARALGGLNHPLALVIPYSALALPLAIWILESAYRQIPREIGEAAALDGLSPLRRLVRIELPLALPSVVTAGILVFIACWNEFLLALAFLTRDESKTITAGIASVGGSSIHEIPWGQLAAAVVVATAPLFVLVFLFERRIAGGLTRGAVKG
jgi:multiple sugar transport system permease protein